MCPISELFHGCCFGVRGGEGARNNSWETRDNPTSPPGEMDVMAITSAGNTVLSLIYTSLKKYKNSGNNV